MNFMPLVGFWWRQHQTITNVFHDDNGKGRKLALDLVNALLPVVREHWPALNVNGLLDDFETTINEVLAGNGGVDAVAKKAT